MSGTYLNRVKNHKIYRKIIILFLNIFNEKFTCVNFISDGLIYEVPPSFNQNAQEFPCQQIMHGLFFFFSSVGMQSWPLSSLRHFAYCCRTKISMAKDITMEAYVPNCTT